MMTLLVQYRILIVVVLSSCFCLAQATEPPQQNCEAVLSGKSKFEIVASPRAPQDAQFYREYVKELTEPGGTLDKLGIEITSQVVEFMVPLDLNAFLAGSAGGYPIQHYLDGAEVLKSMSPKGGFALEVVFPGPLYQHGFYRDDNHPDQQISIIDHVIGHNMFAAHSGLRHYRAAQGLESTRKLDTVVADAYLKFDKDTVMRDYLFMQTLVPLVEMATPLFEEVKDFAIKPLVQIDPLGRVQDRQPARHPEKITENVLHAFAANISPNDPPYVAEILKLLTESMAFRPALTHTQILNEGLASIMQEILFKYSKSNRTLEYVLNAHQVMQSEKQPKLSDPYSLGVHGWRHLRKRLWNSDPALRNADELTRDRAFLKYVIEYIGRHTDEYFIRDIVDEEFVYKYKLAVTRRARPDEQVDMAQPQPRPGEPPPAQWIVVSREPKRVAQMLIDQVLRRKYMFRPRIKLMDFNRPSTGEVDLVIDDEIGRAVGLNQNSVGPSLYALANIIGKPVSLEATFATLLTPRQKMMLKQKADLEALLDWYKDYPEYQAQIRASIAELSRALSGIESGTRRGRVVVSPRGDVQAYRIVEERFDSPLAAINTGMIRDRHLTEVVDTELKARVAGNVAAYISDLYLEDDKELQEVVKRSQTLREIAHIRSVGEPEIAVPEGSMALQAPNSAGAIFEYTAMTQRRMAAALARAMRSQGNLAVGPNGNVRVRVLPSVVNFGFDSEHIQELFEDVDPEPMKTAMMLNRTFAAQGNPLNPDFGGDGRITGPLDGREGDRFWGPGNPNGGNGKPRDPGEDGEDPSFVEIPQDLWSKFLGEQVKLPKLNKKPGESRRKTTRQGGKHRKTEGQFLHHLIAQNAAMRGVGAAMAEGSDPMEDIDDTMMLGFENLRPTDIFVKHKRPAKTPDAKAVVAFVLDASGSTAPYMEAFKRFVNDMEALIRANYKGFKFEYIVFDGRAHRMKTRKEFFSFELGGGTMYKVGIEKTKEIFQTEYPRAQWDRFAFLLGDMEDFGDEGFPAIKSLLEESEYLGVVAGLYRDTTELLSQIRAEQASNEQVGVTVLGDDGGYTIDNIREVLRNEPEN